MFPTTILTPIPTVTLQLTSSAYGCMAIVTDVLPPSSLERMIELAGAGSREHAAASFSPSGQPRATILHLAFSADVASGCVGTSDGVM